MDFDDDFVPDELSAFLVGLTGEAASVFGEGTFDDFVGEGFTVIGVTCGCLTAV